MALYNSEVMIKFAPFLRRYSNHPATAKFLVSGSEVCCQGVFALNHDRSYINFEFLKHCLRCDTSSSHVANQSQQLRHGEKPASARDRIPDIHSVFNGGNGGQVAADSVKDPSAHFSKGMLGASRGTFRPLPPRFRGWYGRPRGGASRGERGRGEKKGL